jgi:hypothetical protein
MFLWNDPYKQNTEREVNSDNEPAPGLVSTRWLALDAILRSLIIGPADPEMQAMMRSDLRSMHATGRVPEYHAQRCDAYQEAVGVLTTWKKTLSS